MCLQWDFSSSSRYYYIVSNKDFFSLFFLSHLIHTRKSLGRYTGDSGRRRRRPFGSRLLTNGQWKEIKNMKKEGGKKLKIKATL